MRVRLIRPFRPDGRDERASIREDREYSVLAIECDDYRLLDEYGEPTLHDSDAFEITNSAEPVFWFCEMLDGCRYAGPIEWRRCGFFEDWHDGAPEAIELFSHVVSKHYPEVENDLIPRTLRKHDSQGSN